MVCNEYNIGTDVENLSKVKSLKRKVKRVNQKEKKKHYITEEQRKLLQKKIFKYFILSGYIVSLLRKNKILPSNFSDDKIYELRDRAIIGSPLTKK